MKNTNYTAKDITVLSDFEHVRLRTNVYLGNVHPCEYNIPLFKGGTLQIKPMTFIPAVYKAVGEILDNVIDEFSQTTIANKQLSIGATPENGRYTISDNGRGIPVDKHETGKYTPEVVFGSLRSGRNFKNDKEVGVIGANGVGSSCVVACSTEFNVEIKRDGKVYKQAFKHGGTVVTKPSIRAHASRHTGTSVTFQLDDAVFDNTALPPELMENRAIELALTNPGIQVDYNGTRYKFKKGFDDIIKQISTQYFKFESNGMEFFVIFDVNQGIDEQIFSWVNSSLLFDGGLCNTQFFNAFVDRTVEHLSKEAKKAKCDVTKNDVRRNLLIIGNLKISDPQYDSQAKTRLTGPNLRKEMVDIVDQQWVSFSRRNKDWLQGVLEQAMVRHHSDANSKAIKEHQKGLKRKIAGLIDATSKNYFERQILITEGDSASSMITQARDPRTTATLPLGGKVNNVYGSTVAQLLNMGKMTDLLAAIGLVPGHKATRSDLRYGKIIIATDADVDGSDIFTLLVNLFYQYWPELFDKNYDPIVYRLIAPNVCLVKGNQRIHFASRAEYEAAKDKYKGWTVNYYKGLGAMGRQDWEMILTGETNTLTPIIDDGNMKPVLKLLFGPDADARKEWLQSNE